MPGTFAFPEASTDVWIPLALRPADRDSHESRWLHTIARIDRRGRRIRGCAYPGRDDDARQQFPQIQRRLARPHRAAAQRRRGAGAADAVVLSLAIACVLLVMIVNLLTAVSARLRRRRAELSLQHALGAGLWRVTRQLGTEARGPGRARRARSGCCWPQAWWGVPASRTAVVTARCGGLDLRYGPSCSRSARARWRCRSLRSCRCGSLSAAAAR